MQERGKRRRRKKKSEGGRVNFFTKMKHFFRILFLACCSLSIWWLNGASLIHWVACRKLIPLQCLPDAGKTQMQTWAKRSACDLRQCCSYWRPTWHRQAGSNLLEAPDFAKASTVSLPLPSRHCGRCKTPRSMSERVVRSESKHTVPW